MIRSEGLSSRLRQPSTFRITICPDARDAHHNIAAVSALGGTVSILIRRLDTSRHPSWGACRTTIARDVRIDFLWLFRARVMVRSLAPASSKLAAAAWHFSGHLRLEAWLRG
ncbi:MAG: hypothetical protein ACREDJ_02240 [Methylocella sp.]